MMLASSCSGPTGLWCKQRSGCTLTPALRSLLCQQSVHPDPATDLPATVLSIVCIMLAYRRYGVPAGVSAYLLAYRRTCCGSAYLLRVGWWCAVRNQVAVSSAARPRPLLCPVNAAIAVSTTPKLLHTDDLLRCFLDYDWQP